MAVVDTKNTLKLKIGSNNITLPIYETHDDFYNGKYMSIKTGGGERYVPLSSSQSEYTVNAGIIEKGTKYYFLTQAFTTSNSVGGGSFFKYISGGSNSMQFTNLISLDVPVPETHKYKVTFKAKFWHGFNSYKHGYRAESRYRYQIRQGENILIDTGLHNCSDTPLFRSYSSGAATYESSQAAAKWYTFGTLEMKLNAGKANFQLWGYMEENNNKNANMFVEPFQIDLEYA